MPKPGLGHRVGLFWGLHVLQKPKLVNVKRWVRDRGDETLRLDYPIDHSSVVFEVGGYLGGYAEAIHRKFGCRVYLFEPVRQYYLECVKRFSGTPGVVCLNYGLSASSGKFRISIDGDASSLKKSGQGNCEAVELRTFAEAVAELGVDRIDLLSINIEGGEYDLLPALTDSGMINRINYLQVQFHDFIAGAAEMRSAIRGALSNTHREMWSYDFVWESWETRPR